MLRSDIITATETIKCEVKDCGCTIGCVYFIVNGKKVCSVCKEDVKMISLDSEESYGRQSIHLCKDCRLLLSDKLRESVK